MDRTATRGRKFPVKRDSSGKSARQRAFELFSQGTESAQVAKQVGISRRTVRRYRVDWRKLRHPEQLLGAHSLGFTDKSEAYGKVLTITAAYIYLLLKTLWKLPGLCTHDSRASNDKLLASCSFVIAVGMLDRILTDWVKSSTMSTAGSSTICS